MIDSSSLPAPAAAPALPNLAPYGVESHWLRRTAAPRRLLAVYAHPDDESFGNAGTLARYSAAGVAVHYVCATRGECGTVQAAFLAGHADIAALRSAELTCAARVLDLQAVHYLNYRDSGMPGSPDNDDPRALVQAPGEVVTGQVVAAIRALRPQVVLTFGPYGGYGHPDHIRIHEATRVAFAAAGDAGRFPAQIAAGLAAWSPRKLYYPTFGAGYLRLSARLLGLLGRDLRHFGANGDVDLLRALEETTRVTAVVDCRAFLAQIDGAWRCHASQLGSLGLLARLPRPIRRLYSGREQFTRVVPPPRPGRPERDLFAGLRPTAGLCED